MSFDGIASVQARISAIEEKIQSLQNQGRPPVALTEGGPVTGTNQVDTNSAAFATELAAQVANANRAGATTNYKGVVQGIPGTAEAFVAKVRSYIGVPYVWGGTDPSKGLDCSGLVQTAARQVGVKLPRVTYDQQHAGVEVPSLAQAKPGDLIITNKSGHVVVYIGDGKVIHAPRPGKTVTEAKVSDIGPIVTIRRVMRSADDAPAAGSKVNPVSSRARMMSQARSASSPDLAASLVGALSGSGGANQAGMLSQLMGSVNSNNSYNSTLLSQFMGSSSLYGTNASNNLNSLIGGGTASANASLSNTASSLSAVAALRSSLGV